MTESARSLRAHRVVVISGVLAVVAGLIAIGIQLFFPLVTVHVNGDIQHWSYWNVYGGFVAFRPGLAAVGLCLLCLLTIGNGALAYGARREARGRLFLWSGAALLALEVVLTVTAALQQPVDNWLFPMMLVAPYLFPSMALAALASGAAVA